jgi:hypothetical protein
MARVGRRFVASSVNGKLTEGVTFYDTPKPFERALCRVNAYFVEPKVITRSWPKSGQTYWDDDLTVTRRYAVWTSPSQPDENEDRARSECAAYRDFTHTFIADESNPERGPILLDILLRIAKGEGRAPFVVWCVEVASAEPRAKKRACDSRAVLRRWSLKQLQQVQNVTTTNDVGGRTYWDTLFIAAPSANDDYSISVRSWEPASYRRTLPSDIKEVTIFIGRNCVC